MIYQNDPRLDESFRKEGCSARSLIAMAEVDRGMPLTIDELESVIAEARKDPTVLGAEATTGANEHKLTEFAFSALGVKRLYRQIGVWKDDHWEDWSGNQIDASTVRFAKMHWSTGFPSGHWTLGDVNCHEIWDPWCTKPGFNPWDSTGKVGYTINKQKITAAYCYRLYDL